MSDLLRKSKRHKRRRSLIPAATLMSLPKKSRILRRVEYTTISGSLLLFLTLVVLDRAIANGSSVHRPFACLSHS